MMVIAADSERTIRGRISGRYSVEANVFFVQDVFVNNTRSKLMRKTILDDGQRRYTTCYAFDPRSLLIESEHVLSFVEKRLIWVSL